MKKYRLPFIADNFSEKTKLYFIFFSLFIFHLKHFITFKNMDTTIFTVMLAFMITHIVYTENGNPQDSLAKSQMLYEAQATIPAHRTNIIYSNMEKDRISLNEITISE